MYSIRFISVHDRSDPKIDSIYFQYNGASVILYENTLLSCEAYFCFITFMFRAYKNVNFARKNSIIFIVLGHADVY